MDRRAFMAGVLALAVTVATPVLAQGEYRPSKPIDLVIHGGPGGGADAFARAFISAVEKEKLSPVRVQINYKVGGGGAIAMSYMVEKKGDPSTIALFASVWFSNSLVQAEMRNSIKDITVIGRL